MADNRVFVARSNVVDCDIGGDRALLDVETNSYFTINATAFDLWSALSEPKTLAELVHMLTEKHDVEYTQCRSEIEIVLDQMYKADILTVSDAAR